MDDGTFKGLPYTIAHLFLAKGYKTQRDIAEACGVSSTTVHEIMIGKSVPTPKFVQSMVSSLGLDVEDTKWIVDSCLELNGWSSLLSES
jgi:transcriptional regulator with XRE-family HTH domain